MNTDHPPDGLQGQLSRRVILSGLLFMRILIGAAVYVRRRTQDEQSRDRREREREERWREEQREREERDQRDLRERDAQRDK
jgi:hypothetical protein